MKYVYDKDTKLIVAYIQEKEVEEFIKLNSDKNLEVNTDKETVDTKEPLLDYLPPTKEDIAKAKINSLRNKREPLLVAFDKYKSNVYYGIEVESDEQRQEIINWYNLVLDLDEESINNPPERIKYYL